MSLGEFFCGAWGIFVLPGNFFELREKYLRSVGIVFCVAWEDFVSLWDFLLLLWENIVFREKYLHSGRNTARLVLHRE